MKSIVQTIAYAIIIVTLVGCIPIQFPEDMRTYKVIELEMSTNKLFPDYFGPSLSYKGRTELNRAFKGGNTSIKTIATQTNLPSQQFVDDTELHIWTVQKAGGDPYANPTGLAFDVSIVAALDDVSTTVEGTGAVGFAFLREVFSDGSNLPSRAYILCDRIIAALPSDQYSQVVNFTGTGIHELGHARGIDGDGASINPPHGGSYQSICIMRSDGSEDYLAPTFCDNHSSFLKSVTW